MKYKIILSLLMFIALAILDAILVWLGFYDRNIPVDLFEHFLGGIVLGIMGMWWFKSHRLSDSPKFLSIFVISTFALLGSFIWELMEYGLFHLTPNFADYFYLYSATTSDLLSDMVCGLAGGLLVAIYFVARGNKQ